MSIEAELVSLTNESGFINPREVVTWAEANPESALHQHKQFHWDDDARAAGEWRLSVARQLISVYVRDDDGNRGTISLISDRTADGGYRHIGPVMQNAELRAMALRQALREFRRWEQRYKHLAELARVFDAANQVGQPPGEAAA